MTADQTRADRRYRLAANDNETVVDGVSGDDGRTGDDDAEMAPGLRRLRR